VSAINCTALIAGPLCDRCPPLDGLLVAACASVGIERGLSTARMVDRFYRGTHADHADHGGGASR